jgi:hypothetical protein
MKEANISKEVTEEPFCQEETAKFDSREECQVKAPRYG